MPAILTIPIMAMLLASPVVEARTLVVMAVAAQPCTPGPVIDPNTIPYPVTLDAKDTLLPLYPHDTTKWTAVEGMTLIRTGRACHPDGLPFRVWCQWAEDAQGRRATVWPKVTYDEQAGTWTMTIVVQKGTFRYVFRAAHPDGSNPSDYQIPIKSEDPPPSRIVLR